MTKEPGSITATERRQLIALIKLHFAVLRKEVDNKERKLISDVDMRVAEKIRQMQHEADDLRTELTVVTEEANKALKAVIEKYPALFTNGGRWREPQGFFRPSVFREQTDEQTMRRAMVAKIRAHTSEARIRLQRDEVEKLRELHLDALVTEAARELAASLPSLTDLIPADVLELAQ